MSCRTVNLEQGLPRVADALARLEQELRTARARRVPVLKIIHGYGSSGKGGAIRRDARKLLEAKKNAGQIRAFCAGEDFSPFSPDARRIIDEYPELRKDGDYSKGNDGITIVML